MENYIAAIKGLKQGYTKTVCPVKGTSNDQFS